MASKSSVKTRPISIKESSGNVFADLGLANPEQELLKAKLVLQIYRTIKERKLTQTQAGEILGIKQPHVSSLMRGQSGMFSAERLMDFLTELGTRTVRRLIPVPDFFCVTERAGRRIRCGFLVSA